MSSITVDYTLSRNSSDASAPLILDYLRDQGILIRSDCGGKGSCGKCNVILNTSDGVREVPACKTFLTENCQILIPESSLYLPDSFTEQSDRTKAAGMNLISACDLGTTTLVMGLYDKKSGCCLAEKTELNTLASYGSDVISRVHYCMEHPEGLIKLSDALKAQIMGMLASLSGDIEINEMTVAGNTIMQHILAAIDPSSLALAPYIPKTLFTEDDPVQAGKLSMKLLPCISAYIGGDITAGLYASELYQKKGSSLLIDIGTNGEMALGGRDGFKCCSVATGPAFEGAEISCGRIAGKGAVNHFRWEDASLKMEVIGGGEADGICGSGLIDLLAILLDLGIIDESGWLMPPDDADYVPKGLRHMLIEDEDGNGLLKLTDKVYFTSRDVRKLQLAKAAVAAGIEVLTLASGLEIDAITSLYLAGNFGEHINTENAARIGMIPDILKDKVICLGNTSLKGAAKAALNPDSSRELQKILSLCEHIELSGNPEFTEAFVDHMSFESDD